MGLDQFAYVAAEPGRKDSREIAYWRKHPNLQGWMGQLWQQRNKQTEFNGDELELTWDDLARLEEAVLNGKLPRTEGFFFGNDADEYYRAADLEFIRNARAEIFLGLRVFYNSSW